ncbi:hypothetical protein BGX34_010626 [Mortierella sp. NVP85]|nr:hypothetical protein BGX34_010626 [Mortierella sp. NVP85]
MRSQYLIPYFGQGFLKTRDTINTFDALQVLTIFTFNLKARKGPVQLTGWLTYKEFKAVRESKPGIWPEWSHALLINPKTKIDPSVKARGAATNFTICPTCEMDTFLDQLKEYRETHFEQCDRMAPVRGSYWREDVALKIYSELDTINRAPGAGANYQKNRKKNKVEQRAPSLTRGWRFVPNGCTMTKTSGLPNASSQDPYLPTCDSIASPGVKLAPPRHHQDPNAGSNNNNIYPRRRILFIGDSQVRTTYNAILDHYRRPIDLEHQRFAFHDEFIPGLEDLGEESTPATKHKSRAVVPSAESDTAIEMIYKADQFLNFLVHSDDDELDQYDTIYLNLGQWPASGPSAGGQWSTDMFLKRWEEVMERLNRWKRSREEKMRSQSLHLAEENSTAGSGESSMVIWAGMNAFPMRTDPYIKAKGDWRTNARLGYWDDWIETISQEAGGWIRRLNAWQLTFPLLDQVTDKAHFQLTDAIDALKIEALYKLDLCSRMRADIPN